MNFSTLEFRGNEISQAYFLPLYFPAVEGFLPTIEGQKNDILWGFLMDDSQRLLDDSLQQTSYFTSQSLFVPNMWFSHQTVHQSQRLMEDFENHQGLPNLEEKVKIFKNICNQNILVGRF